MAYNSSKGKLHENDHAHKHEKDFRIIARRNKLLGHWAAGLMGFESSDAEAYAKEVVSADLEEPGDEDVIRKLLGDLERSGNSIPREKLTTKMDELLAKARDQLQAL
jgi:hypothetical protein